MELETQLAASGISLETARKAGVIRVSSAEARNLGFSGNGYDAANLSGLAFPYRHPTSGELLVTRIRPDVAFQGRKYLAPTGSRNHLYLPTVRAEQLTDPRFAAIIVEGEKKALALIDVVGSEFLVIGVSGVWNWRTSDKEKRPERDRPGSKTARVNSRPLEDLDWITWRDRAVYLCFDSDGAKNEQVQAAEEALAFELRKRSAKPLVVSIPSGENGAKAGIDDWLVQHESARRLPELKRLLAASAPKRRRHSPADDALDLTWEPPGGFLRTFDEFADEQTDAPAVYRPFTALSVLSAVVGRRITAPWFGAAPLVPNLYVCLLGASSFAHKTTMITMAKRLIKSVRPETILPDDFSPEQFIELLAKQPECLQSIPEFAGFLARAGRDYNIGVRELFMELYDCPSDYKRSLRSGDVVVDHPVVNLLAASATSWLADAMKGGDLRSGFFNRFCFVLGERQDKLYPLPGTVAIGGSQLTLMQSQLKEIAGITGQVDYSAVRPVYERWYRELVAEGRRTEPVEAVSAFYARLAVAAMKIAILLELASTRNLTISPASMEEAIVLVNYLRKVVKYLLRVEFAASPFAKNLQRVLTVIGRHPGVGRGDILKKTGFNAKELTEVLNTLQEQNDVYQVQGKWWAS